MKTLSSFIYRPMFFIFSMAGLGSTVVNGMVPGLDHQSPPPQVVVNKTFGSFSDAISLSCATSGDLFVLDEKRSTVYKYSSNGDEEKKFGGKGWGDYEFDEPCDIAANFLLELYVADRNNRRIQQYDRTMNYVQSYAEEITTDIDGKLYPRSVTVAPQGNLFILDSDGNRILKLNSRHQIVKAFGTYSEGKGKLVSPIDITATSQSDIVVLDDSKLIVFDYYGNYLREIPLEAGHQWCAVSAFDKGIVAVSRTMITVLTIDGTTLFSLSTKDLVTDVFPLEYRDASIHNSRFFILTPTTILDCSIIQ